MDLKQIHHCVIGKIDTTHFHFLLFSFSILPLSLAFLLLFFSPPISLNTFFYCVCVFVCMCVYTQSCLILCDPMGCSLPGPSVYGILQARILEQVAISSARGSSQPRDQTQVSCIYCMDSCVLHQLNHQGSFVILLNMSFLLVYVIRRAFIYSPQNINKLPIIFTKQSFLCLLT